MNPKELPAVVGKTYKPFYYFGVSYSKNEETFEAPLQDLHLLALANYRDTVFKT